jgi:catechol 2,3-dioxygenase-like lactoylglutathione lyase family enzyme
MISGAHVILYSTNPDADRAFLRDVLGLSHVDVGHGWLIFGLPPSEVAVHPSDANDKHELFLMCDDVDAFMQNMKRHGIPCGPIQEQRWGRITPITLPGGGTLSVYQPLHARPAPMAAPKRAASP